MDNKVLLKEILLKHIKNKLYRKNDTSEEKKDKEKILDNFIDNIFNKNVEVVAPLNELETKTIRTYFGIENDNLNIINSDKIILDIILKSRIVEYIYTEYNLNNSKSVFDKLPENKKSLKDKSLLFLNINNKSYNYFKKNRIFTIGHLLNITKNELFNLNKANSLIINKMINEIHELGLVFIDELSIEDQKEILKRDPLNIKVERMFSKKISNQLIYNNIYTINDLTKTNERDLLNIRNFGKRKIEIINNKLSELGFNFNNTIEDNNTNIGDCKIFYLFPDSISNALIRSNINTVNDLINKSENNLLTINGIGETKIKIIKDKLRELNLSLLEDEQVYNNKKELLKFPISMLFPQWICRGLLQKRIITLEDLLEISELDLLEIRTFGPKKIGEIKKIVHSLGFKLKDEDNEELQELTDKIMKYINLKKEKRKLEEQINKLNNQITEEKNFINAKIKKKTK